MASLPRVIIRPKRARPFFARHPWVFVTSIERVEGDPKAGDEVVVVSYEGQFIGRGLFNQRSAIRVRLYRWDDAPIDEEFLSKKIKDACSMRTDLLGLSGPKSATRMIYSEADGLSGLTVDRFDRWLVVQFTSLALFEKKELILRLLAEAPGPKGFCSEARRGFRLKRG